MNPTDQTPLTQESEALLAEVHGTQMALTVYPSRLRAIEAAAARRAIEGSGVVSVARAAQWFHDGGWVSAPEHGDPVGCRSHVVRDWLQCEHRNDHEQRARSLLAALPRPEETRVERCDELREKARLLSQWADAVDFMPDELRAELRDLCPRCVVCGMLEGRHTPPERLVNIGQDPHPFTPVAR